MKSLLLIGALLFAPVGEVIEPTQEPTIVEPSVSEEPTETPSVSEETTTAPTEEQPSVAPTEPTTPETPEEPEINKHEDKDGNGIPDFMEDWWLKNVSKSISLGAVVGIVSSLLTAIIGYLLTTWKGKKFEKGAKNYNDTTKESMEALNGGIDKLDKAVEEITNLVVSKIEVIEGEIAPIKEIKNYLTSVINSLQTLGTTLGNIDGEEFANKVAERVANIMLEKGVDINGKEEKVN